MREPGLEEPSSSLTTNHRPDANSRGSAPPRDARANQAYSPEVEEDPSAVATETRSRSLVDFSIIIPTRRRLELLLTLLDQLFTMEGPSREVIVIDDASSANLSVTVRKRFPEAKVIRNEKPLGFDALPKAVEMACGRFILQLDDDAYPDAKALTELLEHFERRGPELAIVAMPFVEPKSGRMGYSTYFPVDSRAPVSGPAAGFAAGAVAVRREAALEVPLSPPGYRMYETEVPTTIEFLRRGWEVDYLLSARIYHLWEARDRKVGVAAAYLGLRNDLVTIERYFRGWRRWEMRAGRLFTGFIHLAAAGRPRDAGRASREAREMVKRLGSVASTVPKDVLARVYPSFDGLTLMTLPGRTNLRRVAWFLGLLPIDQVV